MEYEGPVDVPDILREDPRMAYMGYSPFWGRHPFEQSFQRGVASGRNPGFGRFMGGSPNRQSYYQNAFEKIHDLYTGELARRLQGDTDGKYQFTNYLEEFPWRQHFAAMSPRSRGAFTSQYAPFAQWV